MESNQNNTDYSQEKVHKNAKLIFAEDIEEFNYLYPNGHRITHQMRWYKGSRDRGLSSDIAA